MNEETIIIQEKATVSENPYSLAGWLAIVMAVLFPLSFFLGFLQNILLGVRPDFPTLGPADLVVTIFTIFGIYVLLRFRAYMNDQFQFHGIDTLIIANIIWSIAFQGFSLLVKVLYVLEIVQVPHSRAEIVPFVFLYLMIVAAFMIIIGIIDLNIAIRLLRIKDSLTDMLRIFAYVTIVAGICELSVILSPLSLILIPISCVLLGLIMLRAREEVEFV